MSSGGGFGEQPGEPRLSGTVLGTCPDCGAPIPRTHLLIEYETSSGSSCFAECPACLDVVHPQP